MVNLDRKKFLKNICFTGFCLCGHHSIGLANNTENSKCDDEPQETKKNLHQEWISILLSNISEVLDENKKREILKSCSLAHYKQLEMDKILMPFKNNLEKFICFLEDEWKWKIDYNEKTKTLLADENKDYCVCPIISKIQNVDLSTMCYCSEGFAESMFSYIMGSPTTATVISSIHRGNDKCMYKIFFD